MFKNKNIFNVLPLLTLFTLSSCGSIKAVHDEQGYTVKVTYNLGEGKYSRNDMEYHELICYYAPESPIPDISTLTGYTTIKNEGFTLDGWYFDENYQNKVDFSTYKLDKNTLEINLYAKWKANIRTYFNIFYYDLDANEMKLLKEVDLEVGKELTTKKAALTYPDTTSPYTLLGMFTDENMETKLTSDYTLSEEENVKNVYTKWIAGDYKVISTAKDFVKYYGSNNLYIDADLDFTGVRFIRPTTLVDKTILGNNHKLSNISYTITDTSKSNEVTGLLVSDSLTNSTIKDLVIENSNFTVSLLICKFFYLAGVAGKIENSTIENVKVNATVTFDEDTLTRYEKTKLSLKNECGYQINELISNNNQINIQSNLEE